MYNGTETANYKAFFIYSPIYNFLYFYHSTHCEKQLVAIITFPRGTVHYLIVIRAMAQTDFYRIIAGNSACRGYVEDSTREDATLDHLLGEEGEQLPENIVGGRLQHW